MLEPMLFAELSLLGLFTGFSAGLLGIGGGMLQVPFLTAILTARGLPIELAIKMAIATSMASIVFTSMSSVRAHHKRGAVRWDLVLRLAPGIVAGAAVASLGVFNLVKGAGLALVFAVFVGFSATQMLLNKQPKTTRTLPGPQGQFAAGGVIGFISGMVGAGGGFISVPFLTWCNVSIHNAIATSAALGFPIALANTLGFVVAGWGTTGLPQGAVGYVFTPALLAVALASVLMAPVGAKVAHSMDVKPLKRMFAFLLYGLALYMGYQGLTA